MCIFWSFTFSFDVDILASFGLLIVLAIFSKMWVIFLQSSGHPGLQHCSKFLPVSQTFLLKNCPSANVALSSFTLAKFAMVQLHWQIFVRKNVTDIAWQFHLPYLPWPIEKILCVMPTKVAKASSVVTVVCRCCWHYCTKTLPLETRL
jgi:hypothetical protein